MIFANDYQSTVDIEINYSHLSSYKKQTNHHFSITIANVSLNVELIGCKDNYLTCAINGIRRAFCVITDENQPNNFIKFHIHSTHFGDFTLIKKPRLPYVDVEDSSGSGYSAPMPGKVIDVIVSDGQSVKVGDVLLGESHNIIASLTLF